MVELRPPRRQRNYRNLSFGAGVAEIMCFGLVCFRICLPVTLKYFKPIVQVHLVDKNISRNYAYVLC